MLTDHTLLFIIAIALIIVIVSWFLVGLLVILLIKKLMRSLDNIDKTVASVGEKAHSVVEHMAPVAIGLTIARKLRRLFKDR